MVPAKAMSADVIKMVKDDGGAHKVKTVGGCELTLKSDGGSVTVTGALGADSGDARAKLATFLQSLADQLPQSGSSGNLINTMA